MGWVGKACGAKGARQAGRQGACVCAGEVWQRQVEEVPLPSSFRAGSPELPCLRAPPRHSFAKFQAAQLSAYSHCLPVRREASSRAFLFPPRWAPS